MMLKRQIIKKFFGSVVIVCVIAGAVSSCADSAPMVDIGVEGGYYIYRMQKLILHPEFTGAEYCWSLQKEDGSWETVSTEHDYVFISATEGEYKLRFEIIDIDMPYEHDFEITVMHEDSDYSPYISKVYEYMPAPGQFVNELPQYEPGDTEQTMLQKVQDCLSGTNDMLISLGSFGGYVVFGFDHTVMNYPGEYDFRIKGNAFYEVGPEGVKGGSSEPGIVWVSLDANGNGVPDDEWYELAGSDYNNPLTRRCYSVTYNAPDPDREVVEDGPYIKDKYHVVWTDADGAEGTVPRNSFHDHSYYPQWLAAKQYTLSGSLLPANAIRTDAGRYFLRAFEWGYADNHPNDLARLNSFKIDWAVDKNGVPVWLPGIDFVRVQCAQMQYCSWIGETSTEISHAVDLHLSGGSDTPYSRECQAEPVHVYFK